MVSSYSCSGLQNRRLTRVGSFFTAALYKLGYTNVFLHVGDNVRVHSPRGEPVAPLVTGTFGSADL